MRQIALALLFASPLFATGCNKNNAENAASNVTGLETAAPPLFKNMPGVITGNRAAGINSSFRIVQAAGGIPSDLYGGACIVFRATDLQYPVDPQYQQTVGKQCTKDEDCANGETAAHYCQKSTKQCFGRPNPTGSTDPYCKRSIDAGLPGTQWTADTDIPISATPVPVPSNLKPGGQAVLVTLLKRKSPANAPPVLEWGTPTTIP